MRKVIASPFITLDGFIAGPQGELDWAVGGEELNLLEATPLSQGVVVLHYQRA